MTKIKLALPGLEIPVTGKQITFEAPCSCDVTECLQIDGVDYTVVDAMGNTVTGVGGVWATGAKITVVLDTENQKAYLLNGNGYPITAARIREICV